MSGSVQMSRDEYLEYINTKQTKQPKTKNKYGNKKVSHNGYTFDSKIEADRYLLLKHYENIGVIKNLELQPKFTLIDKYKRNGKIHRETRYIADFKYTDTRTGDAVVEDAKGHKTDVYMLKRKLFLSIYTDIVFKEIKKCRKNGFEEIIV